MLIAAHSIAGGVVGAEIGNPFLAFLVGIVIHVILDFIPHYDTTDDGKMTLRQIVLIVTDALIGFYIISLILKPTLDLCSPFLWGAIGGLFPDILDHNPVWKKTFRRSKIGGKIHQFHEDIHMPQPGFIIGILIQVCAIALSIYFYLQD